MADEHGTETGTEREPTYARVLYDNIMVRRAQGHEESPTDEELRLVANESESLAAERDTLRAEVERLRGVVEIHKDRSDIQREISKGEYPSEDDPRFNRWLGPSNGYTAPEIRYNQLNAKLHDLRDAALTPPAPAEQRGETQGASDG
jgi:hypothetical protein